MGAGSDTTKEDVQQLVMTHRLIVVTINYRLGVFGFLGSEKIRASPTDSVGNWGTLDQQLSLAWVQDNIIHFGGNRKRVTLLGWSAGAASISVHLSMKSSAGLFTKAIMMSGGFTAWAAGSMEEAESLYNKTINAVGCHDSPDCHVSGPVCKCLLEVSGEILVNEQQEGGWAPTVDGVELLHHPHDAVKRGTVHKGVPIIIGGALEDCLFDIGAAAKDRDFHKWLAQSKAPEGIAEHYLNEDMKEKLYYGPMGPAHRGWSPAYWAVRSASADEDINCRARRAAELWLNTTGAHAYWYLWKAPPSHLMIPPPAYSTELHEEQRPHKDVTVNMCWPCPGAGHGADLPYLFEHSKMNVNDDMAEIADAYQAFFKDFVRYGNPNRWNGLVLAESTGSQESQRKSAAWSTMANGKGGMLFSPGHLRYVQGLKSEVCSLWGV
jgi:carboxylesterase type B